METLQAMQTFHSGSLTLGKDLNYITNKNLGRSFFKCQKSKRKSFLTINCKIFFENFTFMTFGVQIILTERMTCFSAWHQIHIRIDYLLVSSDLLKMDLLKLKLIGSKTLTDHSWMLCKLSFGTQIDPRPHWS